ncbi:MAG TPA: hypothetical protein VF815_07395 [Myxococcaceae bacterium]|jgi:hypothetical protein
MTTIAPKFTPSATNFRPAVERPLEQARPEAVQAALTQPDEFISGDAVGGGLSAERLGAPSTANGPGALPEALEPFREALDNIARQITPETLSNPLKLGQFIMDAVKELGVAGRDFMDAVTYVRDTLMAYNSGKERLAQGESTIAFA